MFGYSYKVVNNLLTMSRLYLKWFVVNYRVLYYDFMSKKDNKDIELSDKKPDKTKTYPSDQSCDKIEPAKPIALPPLIFASGLLSGFIFDHFIFKTDFYDGNLVQIFGYILVSVGVIIALLGLQVFFKMKENPHPHTETKKLIVRGIFKYSRNPLYLAMAFMYIGVSISLNSLAMLIMFAPVIIVVNYGVILREEKYLGKIFGDEFYKYKKQVRKWL